MAALKRNMLVIGHLGIFMLRACGSLALAAHKVTDSSHSTGILNNQEPVSFERVWKRDFSTGRRRRRSFRAGCRSSCASIWATEANLERGRRPLARAWAGVKAGAGVLKAAIAMGKLPGEDDVQRIYIVDEPALIAHGDAELADENKFGVRDFKLLPVRCAYCKWTETATAHPLFQLLNGHAWNLNQKSTGVKAVPISDQGVALLHCALGEVV